MQWGRLRTWIGAVFQRPKLLCNRTRAWEIYQTVGKQITTSWPIGGPNDVLARFAYHILHASHQKPARYLEIGAFEGRSAAFVYTILEGEARITVVDPFSEFLEIEDSSMRKALDTFLANMEAIGAKDTVRVLKGRSIDHLPKLIDAGEQFDIIYIDGSHLILDVMLDAVLCWRLLARGGLMFFDDYRYRRPDLGGAFRPKLAIDGFVGAMSQEIIVLDVAEQVYLRKK
jgi:predicted O-methyltransferase YrrM